ncbi:M48 family metallopeptidase [Corynebacterium crudilactis]|uniref:Metal-dependent hydrolase n=1 Tax=Corynebacterium crudilactis TaxID=1652495 RepID=A0A172QX98_9CORY|nr:YgjP-like metallopeptidase domain-containing protein [Corynebacterium crudilactis]ANE05260.1 metal-dependent hydrolase [Corynebacterium crudilactis]
MQEIEVIRSQRRTKTVQARIVDGKIQVRIPARMTKAEEAKVVGEVVAKLERRTRSSVSSDADLMSRAHRLNTMVLEGKARVENIRWVSNQNSRWGSCTVVTAEIRISDRLKNVPDYVLDSVLVHELVHTFIPGHSAQFWEWANKTPLAERAKGYLEAYQRWG